jgi:hypothetical protein
MVYGIPSGVFLLGGKGGDVSSHLQLSLFAFTGCGQELAARKVNVSKLKG